MIDVSIIITNYNYSKYLNRSIRSAFVQKYPEHQYEIIVVDDSSTDWSREIIESYGKTIRSIFLEKNGGLASARNVGIKAAKGQYIMFLDADDYLNRDIIYMESMFLELNPNWDAVACDYYILDDNEDVTGRDSCVENPIACGIMFKKEQLVSIGMYDESFKMWEEKDLRIRFLEKFKIHHIKLPLYRYRKHENNLTNDKNADAVYSKKLQIKHNLK
jgi:glycosyltransferase involved in cell wall biosynthesis